MTKLSKNTRRTAFAAVLGTGLIGSAAALLTPLAAPAQQWREDRDVRGEPNDRGYRTDLDDRGYRGDMDDRRYRGDRDDRYRAGLGFGVYPYYSGYYDPYAYVYGYEYGPYCSSYDYYTGYCSY